MCCLSERSDNEVFSSFKLVRLIAVKESCLVSLKKYKFLFTQISQCTLRETFFRYFGTYIWSILDSKIKVKPTLQSFKPSIRRIEEKFVRIVIGIEFVSETSNVIFFKSVHVLLFLMESLINKCQIVTYTCYYKNVSK